MAPRFVTAPSASSRKRRLSERLSGLTPVSSPDMLEQMQTADRRLVEDLLAGDRSAWHGIDQWVERAAAPFRARLGADWADVLQEIRMELLRLLKAGKFRGDSALRTYLWRVANNTCIDQMRRAARRNLVSLDVAPDPPAPASEGPAARTARGDALRLTLAVLREVPEECRRLWNWILEGLSYQEMAARLEVAEGTLRVRVHRCRKRAVEARRQLLTSEVGNETLRATPYLGGAT